MIDEPFSVAKVGDGILRLRPFLIGGKSRRTKKVSGPALVSVDSDIPAFLTKEQWMQADQMVVGAFRRGAPTLNMIMGGGAGLVRDIRGEQTEAKMYLEYERLCEDGSEPLASGKPLFTRHALPLPLTRAVVKPGEEPGSERWFDLVLKVAEAVRDLVELTVTEAVSKIGPLTPDTFQLVLSLAPTLVQKEFRPGLWGFQVLCIIVPWDRGQQ